jgi:MOSC domain-containing protein YiiM
MKLISINVGLERSIPNAKASGKTGIYKLPVNTPVRIASNGIPGDAICDKKNHGGPDQAIYIYGETDYKWWSETLGRELAPGTFGENLTISGLESGQVRIGDVLLIGEVSLQVTSPRTPCVTLAARMGDNAFIKQFQQAERPGLYCRVLEEGQVQSGEPVHIKSYAGETVTILEMFRDYYKATLDEAMLRLYLAAPISLRARADKEKQLQKLIGTHG